MIKIRVWLQGVLCKGAQQFIPKNMECEVSLKSRAVKKSTDRMRDLFKSIDALWNRFMIFLPYFEYSMWGIVPCKLIILWFMYVQAIIIELQLLWLNYGFNCDAKNILIHTSLIDFEHNFRAFRTIFNQIIKITNRIMTNISMLLMYSKIHIQF